MAHMEQIVDKRRQRLQYIASIVQQGGALHLKEAARLLTVSEMTVRRDLATGESGLGYLGGYIVAGNAVAAPADYSLGEESDRHGVLKEQAAQVALGLIETDDVLFLDCGTTTPYLARHIPADKRLTVVCYALNIADILCRNPGIRVILQGGRFHSSSATFFDEEALRTLDRLHITKAFLTAGGVHAERGVSCSHFHEATVKQAVIANAMKNYLLVDSTKFGKTRLAHFAGLDAFDAVVTDGGIAASEAAAVEEAGPKVICRAM